MIESAFVLDATLGGRGGNSIANSGARALTRIRALRIANGEGIFDDARLMSLDSLAASTPYRNTLIE